MNQDTTTLQVTQAHSKMRFRIPVNVLDMVGEPQVWPPQTPSSAALFDPFSMIFEPANIERPLAGRLGLWPARRRCGRPCTRRPADAENTPDRTPHAPTLWHRTLNVEGFSSDDISVTVKDGQVLICATRQVGDPSKGTLDKLELRRTLAIPQDIDETKMRVFTCDDQLHILGKFKEVSERTVKADEPPPAVSTRSHGDTPVDVPVISPQPQSVQATADITQDDEASTNKGQDTEEQQVKENDGLDDTNNAEVAGLEVAGPAVETHHTDKGPAVDTCSPAVVPDENTADQVSDAHKEDPGNFQISANLDGFSPQEIRVKVVDSDIVVTAESEKEDKGVSIMRRFYRKFPLPDNVDSLALNSKLTSDGQLNIQAPVIAKVLERELPIEYD